MRKTRSETRDTFVVAKLTAPKFMLIGLFISKFGGCRKAAAKSKTKSERERKMRKVFLKSKGTDMHVKTRGERGDFLSLLKQNLFSLKSDLTTDGIKSCFRKCQISSRFRNQKGILQATTLRKKSEKERGKIVYAEEGRKYDGKCVKSWGN